MGQETIEVTGEETVDVDVNDEAVLRMVCIEVCQSGELSREDLEAILEATNRQHLLAEAQVFVDEGGADLAEDDDPEEGEEDDEDAEEENDEDEEEP